MEKIKKSENNLHKSDDLFFDMFENSPIGMTVIEIETEKFQFVNQSFLKCFGYSENEIIGKTSSEVGIITSEFREKILLQTEKKESANNIEIILKNKNGEQFWFLVSVQMIQFKEKTCSLSSFINFSKSK